MSSLHARKPHKQVPAKVTMLVDEDMKELVEVLNTIDDVRTFQSCQGGNGRMALVMLEYGDEQPNFRQIAGFAQKLAKLLSEITKQGTGISPDPAYDITLSIKWDGEKRHPFIQIEMPTNSVKRVANIFLAVRRELENDR